MAKAAVPFLHVNQSQGEDWRYSPPYQSSTQDEFDSVKWTGRCHCGQVEYQLKREKPLTAKFCHCQICQILHGAPFQLAAIFPKSDVRFTRGHEKLTFYSSGEKRKEHKLPCKVYCSYCNTPIMDEGRNMCLLFPELIDVGPGPEDQRKRRETFEIKCHIFYGSRIVDIKDGKPKWSGLDEKSELLDDNGQVLLHYTETKTIEDNPLQM